MLKTKRRLFVGLVAVSALVLADAGHAGDGWGGLFGGHHGRGRGSHGSAGGSHGSVGGSYGMSGGSYGSAGGSYGMSGGSHGSAGGSYGMSGGSYGSAGGSYGMSGGSFGSAGGSYGSAGGGSAVTGNTPPENRALVLVRVPAEETAVFFQGQQMDTPGEERRFVTPPLEPGKAYTYKMRVVHGELEEEGTVSVTPGKGYAVTAALDEEAGLVITSEDLPPEDEADEDVDPDLAVSTRVVD